MKECWLSLNRSGNVCLMMLIIFQYAIYEIFIDHYSHLIIGLPKTSDTYTMKPLIMAATMQWWWEI
jgi:hypothetical protein